MQELRRLILAAEAKRNGCLPLPKLAARWRGRAYRAKKKNAGRPQCAPRSVEQLIRESEARLPKDIEALGFNPYEQQSHE